MQRWCLFFLAAFFGAVGARAGTLATLNTTIGTVNLELFDEDKPVTVSNFVKYVTSGRFEDTFVQRWVPGFVIQGGGYYLQEQPQVDVRILPTFGTITNEYSVGRTLSNIYGTIAMARAARQTNSASSQWFINLGDNSGLDQVDGGFTVFGRVMTGTNVLNFFIPQPPQAGIYRANHEFINSAGEPILLNELPVLAERSATNRNVFYLQDLVLTQWRLRRDVGLSISNLQGRALISWDSVAGVTNTIEYSNLSAPLWQPLTNVIGSGGRMTVEDAMSGGVRVYRVALTY